MFNGLPTAGTRACARFALLLTVALAATVVAGCGGSTGNGVASKSATEILAASRAAADGATAVHVVSDASQGELALTSNMYLTSDAGHGQISLAGLSFEVIRTANTLYVSGNHTFYEHLGAAAARLPQGTWLKGPANTGELAQVAALTKLRSQLNVLLASTGPLAKGATTTVDGQQVIELKETANLFSGSLYVATTGKPYPVRIVKQGRETGQTTFSGWNRPVALAAPANAVALK